MSIYLYILKSFPILMSYVWSVQPNQTVRALLAWRVLPLPGLIELFYENICDKLLFCPLSLSFISAAKICNSFSTAFFKDGSSSAALLKSRPASVSFQAPMCALPLLYSAFTLSALPTETIIFCYSP